MKLEHLIQGYNFNRIPVKIEKEINQDNERAGVINFNKNVNASYLLDEEGFVIAINIFANCVVANKKTITNQINHSISILTIIQKSIELIGNTKKEEANEILKQLGLFDENIHKKAVRFTNHIYKIDTGNGLLMISIIEDIENNNKLVEADSL